MKNHVQNYHLTKIDAFGVNRDEVIDLETWFKIHTNVYNGDSVPQNHINSVRLCLPQKHQTLSNDNSEHDLSCGGVNLSIG